MEVSNEYKQNVRKCKVTTRPAGESEHNREEVVVDWSPFLTTPPGPASEFLLGVDPKAEGGTAVIDAELRWAPAPAWANSEQYIAELEAENATLREQLDGK